MGGHNKAKAAKLISTMAIKLQLNGDIKTAIVNRANELFKNSDKTNNKYIDIRLRLVMLKQPRVCTSPVEKRDCP